MNDIRKDLLEEYDEILLKLALDNFSAIKGKEFQLENEKIKECEEFSISQSDSKKISKLLNKHFMIQNISIFIKSTSAIFHKEYFCYIKEGFCTCCSINNYIWNNNIKCRCCTC